MNCPALWWQWKEVIFLFGLTLVLFLTCYPRSHNPCPVCGWWRQCGLGLQCVPGLGEYCFLGVRCYLIKTMILRQQGAAVVKFGSRIFLCFSKVVDAADTYVSHRPLGGLEKQNTWVRNHHPVLELPKELHSCPSPRAGLLACCGTLERCLPLLLFFFFFSSW